MSEHEHDEIADQDDDTRDCEAMTAEDMEDYLAEALVEYAMEQGDPEPRIQTFAEAELLTTDRGLVVRFGRREFQISIVRSR